jgi:hypothetical protein
MDGLVVLAANAGVHDVVSRTSIGILISSVQQDSCSAPIGRDTRDDAFAHSVKSFCGPLANIGHQYRRMRPGSTGRDLVQLT